MHVTLQMYSNAAVPGLIALEMAQSALLVVETAVLDAVLVRAASCLYPDRQ
jgi:hypothetical protein